MKGFDTRLRVSLATGVLLAAFGCGEDDPSPPPDSLMEGEAVPAEFVEPPSEVDASPDIVPDMPDRPVEGPDRTVDTLPPPDVVDPEVEPDAQSAQGIVGVSGTEAGSVAVLRREEGRSLGLTGTLARELIRLGGAHVRVQGRPAATPVGPGLEVFSYQLLEVEGRIPHLGILRRGPGAQWLLHPENRALHGEAVEPLSLVGLPEERLRDGMKIWVVGELDGDGRLAVESYGIVSHEDGAEGVSRWDPRS